MQHRGDSGPEASPGAPRVGLGLWEASVARKALPPWGVQVLGWEWSLPSSECGCLDEDPTSLHPRSLLVTAVSWEQLQPCLPRGPLKSQWHCCMEGLKR